MSQIHAYKNLSPEEQEEVFSRFIINAWSYSKVSSFARNEKAFEMQYVYGVRGKLSATSIAGSAYHLALSVYFKTIKDAGEALDLASLESIAYEYIGGQPANNWKLQKTTLTVEECQAKAFKTASALIENFLTEISVFDDSIKEILEVEVSCHEFLTINGVDIPLPCNLVIDLVFRSVDDKVVVLDHKSKAAFTPEDELALSIGTQAITYVKGYEARTGIKVDEVWFIENKFSKNKDKSPQLNPYRVSITDDTRRLYEALLYEPLKRMIQAVGDPDYIYVINDADNYVDRAELYDFWCRTMVSEVEDFNVPDAKKELVQMRLRKIRDANVNPVPPDIIRKFRREASAFIQFDLSDKDMTNEEKIVHALKHKGIPAEVKHTFDGYSSNTYLLAFSAGVNISSIYGKRLDIANALDVPTVRIPSELVIHDGKSYLAIEHSKKREKDLIFDASAVKDLKLPMGMDNYGNVIIWDLANHSTPHVLVCGATGSGKSVLVRSTIEYAKVAGINDMIIFDPKYEFNQYEHEIPVVNEIAHIEEEMQKLVNYMNELVRTRRVRHTLVIFDEFADAVAQSKGKSLEENLRILLQKGRSCGIRVMAATQRASVKVITGDAKVNFPVQICFRVPKEIDSKVVIDEGGAEGLAGRGDGLMRSPEYNHLVRFQAYYKP